MPQSDDVFSVEKDKNFLNKPYNRINLFLSSQFDYVSITEIKATNKNCNSETSSEVDINNFLCT